MGGGGGGSGRARRGMTERGHSERKLEQSGGTDIGD